MQPSTTVLASSLLVAAVAAAPAHTPPHNIPRVDSGGIRWRTCDLNSTNELNITVPVLCGSLTVPLDYTDPSCTSTVDLPLLKIAASDKAAKKNSILFNFGGPGDNGKLSFTGLGARLAGILGPDHDLITWYPRGTGGDLLFSCYANSTARASTETPGLQPLGNASNVADGQLWASGKVLGDTCRDVQNQNGSLIGTAFAARDAMQIVDALEEDGLIRYWGLSYGTVLGSTIAAMFPDRVDKLLIDGVANAGDYYHGLVLTSRESSDAVLMGFSLGCVQNPERCLIARNRTAVQVYDSVLSLIDDVKTSPFVFTAPVAAGGDFQVDYSNFKSTIYELLYSPADWSALSIIIDAVASRNDTLDKDFLRNSLSFALQASDESRWGIQCGDTFARASTLKDALSYMTPFRDNSFSDVDDAVALACARWPFAAKERYNGNFQVKTPKPILVVGNTWDPATPLSSAKNASLGFEGSVLLEQRGYGHASVAQASLCTAKHIRNYFSHEILPSPGTICKVDQALFPADYGSSSWAYVLRELARGRENGTVISN